MINTKKELMRAEQAETEGRDAPVGIVFELIDEIERLAKICEQLQFGGRPDCPNCFTTSTNYDPVSRDWLCGPCDNGEEEPS